MQGARETIRKVQPQRFIFGQSAYVIKDTFHGIILQYSLLSKLYKVDLKIKSTIYCIKRVRDT
jgi:hypothetical protein